MISKKQIEQKAKELGQKYFPDEYNIWARPNYEAQYIEFACKEMVEWQNSNLWHDAQGDDLPEIDKEVIVLCDNGKVCFGHRPKEYWDGKNIATGEVTRYYPKRYDKCGWNIPDVKLWLDVELPNLEENDD